MNSIQKTLLVYQKILESDICYEYVCGRKGKTYKFFLKFDYETFFHVLGLQHLSDLKFPRMNKYKLFHFLLEDSELQTKIVNSNDFYKIQSRVELLGCALEKLVSPDNFSFWNPLYLQFPTKIEADLVLSFDLGDNHSFLFLSRNNEAKCFFPKSFIVDNGRDFLYRQMQVSVLKVSIISKGVDTIVFLKEGYNEC